jgi:hypothetical protein
MKSLESAPVMPPPGPSERRHNLAGFAFRKRHIVNLATAEAGPDRRCPAIRWQDGLAVPAGLVNTSFFRRCDFTVLLLLVSPIQHKFTSPWGTS